MKCPKCEGEMEQGIQIDRGDYSMPMTPLWGSSKSFWGTIKNKREVVTYRCKECGFLESYAK